MGSEIVALRCPSCANPTNVVARELRFGYEFTCRHCATVSVVIINRQLYVPTPGEHVCLACGRVAPRGSRFCQCGRTLVQTCIACSQEFPVGHKNLRSLWMVANRRETQIGVYFIRKRCGIC